MLKSSLPQKKGYNPNWFIKTLNNLAKKIKKQLHRIFYSSVKLRAV